MKKTTNPKKAKSRSSLKAPTNAPLPPEPAPPVRIIRSTNNDFPLPDLEDLLNEAEEEPSQVDLAYYRPVIHSLRSKGYSYREIADWLTKRGVNANHSAVYRIYTKFMSDDELFALSQMEAEEAQDEAFERGR